MSLHDILNYEISPRKIWRNGKYYGIKAGRKLKLHKLGPGKCLLVGLALHGAGKTEYWIGKNERSEKNYLDGALFIASGYLISVAADIFWIAGGYMAIKKGYKKFKEKINGNKKEKYDDKNL